jgi:plastocyanin
MLSPSRSSYWHSWCIVRLHPGKPPEWNEKEKQHMRTTVLVGAAVIAAVVCGCSSSTTPASPSPSVSGGGGGGMVATQIFILGNNDNRSFRPSPATAAQGSTLVWINSDTETHHVVAIDGSFDTGVLEPDASSVPIVLGTDGARYYCTIHPSEVGSINASNGAPPPCGGPHC